LQVVGQLVKDMLFVILFKRQASGCPPHPGVCHFKGPLLAAFLGI